MLKEVIDGVTHVGIIFPKGMDQDHDGDGNELYGIAVKCRLCCAQFVIHVRVKDYEKWMERTRVQDAFPYIDDEYRELLISGTCPKCWDEMIGLFGLEYNDKDEDEAEGKEADDVSH